MPPAQPLAPALASPRADHAPLPSARRERERERERERDRAREKVICQYPRLTVIVKDPWIYGGPNRPRWTPPARPPAPAPPFWRQQ